MLSFKLSELLKNRTGYFFEYVVKDSDRPDIISHKLYGRSDLHWLVWLMNDIVNPYADWAMPYDSLNDYISANYTGQAFFVDVNDYDNIATNEFVPGNLVTVPNTTQESIIASWEPSIQKLRVVGVTGSFTGGTTAYTQNQDGLTFAFQVSRVIRDEKESLHHFEDSSGNILDPNGYYIDNDLVRVIGTPIPGTNRLIDQYINNGIVTQNVITVQENEEAKNEKNRTIRLIRPEYVDAILKEFNTLGVQSFSKSVL